MENFNKNTDRKAKFNYSRQREVIYQAVMEHRVHPTAEFIYSRLKDSYPKLSLGTVYRNLNLLASTGRVKRLTVAGGPDRYDGDISGHYHAVCEVCGDMSDLEMPYMEELDTANALRGMKVNSHSILFNIICDKCSTSH